MLSLWIQLFMLTVATLAKDTTTVSDTNITTLYPVFNKTITRNEILTRFTDTDPTPSDAKPRTNDTESKIKHTEAQDNTTEVKGKTFPQSWKIESSFVESNLTEEKKSDPVRKEEKKELPKDFKPSQHLGSFFDEDNAEVIKTPVFGPVGKKPASGFISSHKDEYSHNAVFNKIPKEVYQTHAQFPYKFEDTIYTKTKGWRDSLESRPTVEAPVKVPAGGLYQSPDAFKGGPQSEEQYGLEYYEDSKEHAVKKRVNPWQNLLRLATAFIPVGLIISALTPSIITIHNVDDNIKPSSLPYRRSDRDVSEVSHVAPISERCRRRLLCELHSDRNYQPASTLPRRTMKHCYKIHCEDTEALWRMLRWLFSYKQEYGDQRGRLLT